MKPHLPEAFVALLRERTGLVADMLGRSEVAQALARRAEERGLAESRYVSLLDEDATALAELLSDIAVPETWFLRDHQPFEHLGPELTRRRKAPYRVLSLPCSTGEEAYSLVIALSRSGLSLGEIEVDAWDISSRSIEAARQGIYRPFSFRGAPDWLLPRYFHRTEAGFAVSAEVKQRVRFRVTNALSLPRHLYGGAFDAIFCRNLFIYLHEGARASLLSDLLSMLAPEGLLVLGHADPRPAGFERVGPIGAFTFARTTEASSPLPPSPRRKAAEKGENTVSISFRKRPPVRGLAPGRGAGGEDSLSFDQVRALADRGELGAALALCDRLCAERPLEAEGHRLRGVILLASGEAALAEESLKRALYIAPRDEEALTHLALLAEHRGDRGAAAAYWRRAGKG